MINRVRVLFNQIRMMAIILYSLVTRHVEKAIYMVREHVTSFYTNLQWKIIALSMMVASALPAQAQVTLTIPTNDIFTSINNWIVTFAPIVAIGIGIAAAIAILSFVGKQIVSAFKG